ncbi:MAG: hypothetical protein ACP5O7_12605 [Phycisphaerae bacterium]
MYQPGGTIEGSYDGTTSADDNYLADLQGGIWSDDTWLHFGGTLNPPRNAMGAYTPGIEFNASWQLPPAAFGNDYFAVQTISSFTAWLQKANGDYGSQSPTDGTILDTSYPYGWTSPPTNADPTAASTNDSPGINLTAASEAMYNLDFDMHLMFQPTGTDSIPVPVSGATWSWAASAMLNNGTWQVGGTNVPSPPSTAPEESEPQWSGNFLTSSPPHILDEARCEAFKVPNANARLLSPAPTCTAAQGVTAKIEPRKGTKIVVAMANGGRTKIFITTAQPWGWRIVFVDSKGMPVPLTNDGQKFHERWRRFSRGLANTTVEQGSGLTNKIDLKKYFLLHPGEYFLALSRLVVFSGNPRFQLLRSKPAELIVGRGGKVRWKTRGVALPPRPIPRMRALARSPAPTSGPAACLARLAKAVEEGNAAAARSLVYAKRGASQTLAWVKMKLSMRRLSKSVTARFGGKAGKWTERQMPEGNLVADVLAHLDLPTLKAHGHWAVVRVWAPDPRTGKWMPWGRQYFRRVDGRWLVADNPVMAAHFPEEAAVTVYYRELAKIFSGMDREIVAGRFGTFVGFKSALNERLAAEARAQLARLMALARRPQNSRRPPPAEGAH